MQISNEDYQIYKPLLFSLGYRMLGSVTDAEDLVQETFLRAYQIKEQKVENKKAYLCKMMTNRCLDLLKSARKKREQYIGPWNPEPLMMEESDDSNPSEVLLQKEGLSIAYLRMMEHLTPHERAVLLLREGFDFSYVEIAKIVEKNEDNCRKLFSRAKQKISAVENESLHYEKNKSMVNRFIHAFQMQNTNDLLELLSEDVTLYSDGGGKVKAAVRPIVSRPNVFLFLTGVGNKVAEDYYYEIKNINGQPSLVNYINGTIHSTVSFYISHDKIIEIYMTMNPDKLKTAKLFFEV
ncbi:RNA polymerase sigma-70 factor [Bacillus sp. FJAT-47783]|uniref:RNA polymerase sigma-70 factor n=1 Tax=Bacillus sp. FJAT-47783 TaxID=2922712 RepID=UPI001FAC78A1